jgi:hypothetical protein
MKLKLLQAIRANGTQHRPPSVVDSKEIGITDADADVLVRSGVAVIVAEAKQAPAPVEVKVTEPVAEVKAEPEVINLGDEPAAEAQAEAAEPAPDPAKPAAKTTRTRK